MARQLLETEKRFLKENRSDLARRYGNRYLVIRRDEVYGALETGRGGHPGSGTVRGGPVPGDVSHRGRGEGAGTRAGDWGAPDLPTLNLQFRSDDAQATPDALWRHGPPVEVTHCFLPASWSDRITGVKVGSYGEWRMSDHRPLTVSLRDSSA